MLRRLILPALTAAVVLGGSAASAAAAPHQVHGSLKLVFSRVFFEGHNALNTPGRRVEITGLVSPYVAGQRVQVRAFLGRRPILGGALRVFRSPNGRLGRFVVRLRAPGPGLVTVRVFHPRSPALSPFSAVRRYASVPVYTPSPGATGRLVVLLQQRLRALHFYLPPSGVWDYQTELAVDAYHRLLHWGTSTVAGPATIGALLGGVGAFHVRYPRQGHHAEGDLSLQLLALIDGDQVRQIFPISSGKPSTPTVTGSYRVYSRVPGYLPDGMYYSSFFTGGYAIHGFDPSPDYPASHGCMRLPISDAVAAYNWLRMGDWVDSYH